jgi:hypothetical protein
LPLIFSHERVVLVHWKFHSRRDRSITCIRIAIASYSMYSEPGLPSRVRKSGAIGASRTRIANLSLSTTRFVPRIYSMSLYWSQEQPHLACPERYRRIHPSVICQFRAAVPCSKRSDLLFVATRCTAWPGLWVVAMLPTRMNCLSRNKLHSRVLTVACRDQASCGAK